MRKAKCKGCGGALTAEERSAGVLCTGCLAVADELGQPPPLAPTPKRRSKKTKSAATDVTPPPPVTDEERTDAVQEDAHGDHEEETPPPTDSDDDPPSLDDELEKLDGGWVEEPNDESWQPVEGEGEENVRPSDGTTDTTPTPNAATKRHEAWKRYQRRSPRAALTALDSVLEHLIRLGRRFDWDDVKAGSQATVDGVLGRLRVLRADVEVLSKTRRQPVNVRAVAQEGAVVRLRSEARRKKWGALGEHLTVVGVTEPLALCTTRTGQQVTHLITELEVEEVHSA